MFDTPLATNIAAGDPDLPGLLNETRARLNTARAEADYIPRRNISSLVNPSLWSLTGGMAEALKLGPILGFRFILTAVEDIPASAAIGMTADLPQPFLPQMASATCGFASIGMKTVAVRRNGLALALCNLDGSTLSIAEGEVVRCTFTTWSHSVGTLAGLPGVPAS